jgi:hypothetical protein
MSAPITWLDVYQSLKEQGFGDGAAIALIAFFGEGIQNYNKKKP